VVRALDLKFKIAGSVASRSAFKCDPWHDIHTHLPLSPSSIIRYQPMPVGKRAHHLTHWSPCPRFWGFGWCVAEGWQMGD